MLVSLVCFSLPMTRIIQPARRHNSKGDSVGRRLSRGLPAFDDSEVLDSGAVGQAQRPQAREVQLVPDS